MSEITIATQTQQIVLSPQGQPSIVLDVPAPVVVEVEAQSPTQIVLTEPPQPEIALTVPAPIIIELTPQGRSGTITWGFLKEHWEERPVAVGTTAAGKVYTYTLDGVTRYRLVPKPYDPKQDAFYATFTGGVLSDLIVSKG